MSQSQERNEDQLPSATLGTRRETPFTYTPSLLESITIDIKRPFAGQHSWVTNNCLRFTALCPVTGQPDWADICINYIPKQHLVESKSLKEYLGSFRMHGDFHEDVCRIFCEDIVECIQPTYIEVIGQFDSRGSIAIWPYVQWADPSSAWAVELQRERCLHYAPGKYSAQQSYTRSI